jgi:ABC-2 type transport system ATP-binding protein
VHGTRRTIVLFAALILVAAACSSSDTTSGADAPDATAADTGSPSRSTSRPCRPDRPAPPEVRPVEGVAGDFTMVSFDGTEIRFHWYPLDGEAPTILMGPGWGQPGATADSGTGLFGDSPVGALRDEGYHVLTWDPRGFGQSTGTITVDSASAEGKDVQRLVDWLATQPDVALDRAGDPRFGMVGGSYGGGIQLVTAAIDCRVDVIVPTIAWHSLATSLNKSDTVKLGWSGVLYSAAAGRDLDPHITSAYESGRADGVVSEPDRRWFRSRGPGALVRRITAPTLLIQGTVDTLFTLDEAARNYRILREQEVPTAMLWYCGGHGVCLTEAGEPERTTEATNRWLQRWLREDTAVDTGPRVEILDQLGTRHTAPDWPLRTTEPLRGEGSGTLDLADGGGAGPAVAKDGSTNPVDSVAGGLTPAEAAPAVEVPVTADRDLVSAGAPTLTLTYSGTTPDGTRPTRVFAQLVDDATGLVLGNQITPVPVRLDGRTHRVRLPLEMIGHSFTAGQTVTLQLVATTVAYAPPRLGGSVDFDRIVIELPVPQELRPLG